MKNLKMFAIAVMAFAVMAMGVHADNVATYTDKDGYKHEFTTLTQALADVKDSEENVTVTVLKDITNEAFTAVTISGKVTLDLDGHKVSLTDGNIKVEKGTLVVTGKEGSTIYRTGNTGGTLLVVLGRSSHLTVDTNVTVGSKDSTDAAVGLFSDKGAAQLGSAVNATVDIKGTLMSKTTFALTVEGCVEKAEKNAAKVTIYDGAKLSSEEGMALYQAGYAITTIGKATIEGDSGVGAKAGSITFNGTTVTARGEHTDAAGDMNGGINAVGAAIQVESSDLGAYVGEANITLNGGSYTSKKTNAIVINNYNDEKTALNSESVIDGGAVLTSAEDEDGEPLPGIAITAADKDIAEKLLTNLEGFVKDAEFNGAIVGDLVVGGNTKDASAIQATLTKGANVNTDDEGNTTVGEPTPGEPGTTEPGETGDGNQGPTDNVKNPETNDNILVYAGLGLVSLASVAFTAKKRED